MTRLTARSNIIKLVLEAVAVKHQNRSRYAEMGGHDSAYSLVMLGRNDWSRWSEMSSTSSFSLSHLALIEST